MYIHKQIICTVPALGPSEPGKALMEVNELFLASPPPPRPVFISLRLFWSSGVISKTKCLSAHKGRWLICFNASICQASCLLLHSVWKESLASQLAFQDLQAFQHLRQERPTVRLRVCSHVNICLCTYVRVLIHSSSRVGFPASWSIYHPWDHQCAVWRDWKKPRTFCFLQTWSILSVCSSQISVTYEN